MPVSRRILISELAILTLCPRPMLAMQTQSKQLRRRGTNKKDRVHIEMKPTCRTHLPLTHTMINTHEMIKSIPMLPGCVCVLCVPQFIFWMPAHTHKRGEGAHSYKFKFAFLAIVLGKSKQKKTSMQEPSPLGIHPNIYSHICRCGGY